MNLELLESFGQNFPEEHLCDLDNAGYGIAICVKFNRFGSLLAVGSNDGKVAIFDFVTRQIAKTIQAHALTVTGLSWSRNGRRIATCSVDFTVAVWNVLSGEAIARFRFPTHVTLVQFHPRNDNQLLVCPQKCASVLVEVDSGEYKQIPADDELGADLNVIAVFDRKGKHVLTGNGKGKISVFDTSSLQCVTYFRQPSMHAIKNMTVARKGQYFLTNSGDRIIRVYDLREVLLRAKNTTVEPIQKLQDMVNKTNWKTCCLSGNSDYICAGSAKSHALYIWEVNSGSLVKIHHGTKGEVLVDVQWHPCRPIICSVSNGIVSVWAQSHVENWSAFAPDFKELDENVKYEERESEFDVEDEDRSVQLNEEQQVEDEDVDVVTCRPPTQFCSSDEEEETWNIDSEDGPLWCLPNAPDIEAPEENPFLALPTTDSAHQGENRPPYSKQQHQDKVKTYDIDLPLPQESTDSPGVSTVGRKRTTNASQSTSSKPAQKQRRTYSRN